MLERNSICPDETFEEMEEIRLSPTVRRRWDRTTPHPFSDDNGRLPDTNFALTQAIETGESPEDI